MTAGTRGGQPWKIGVRSPRGGMNQLAAKLNLKGGAVVTSGDTITVGRTTLELELAVSE